MKHRCLIFPSLLAGDVGRLEEAALQAEAAGADALHLDIMDGHFVPNISMGPAVVKMAKRVLKIPLNVHLMISRPDRYAATFIEAGADTLTIHAEAPCDVPQTLREIRKAGIEPGISINPETPLEAALPFLEEADELLCMSVHPGFGGQKFMPEVLPKIEAARERLAALRSRGACQNTRIAVDGGIDLDNVELVAKAGASAIVAGSSLYRSKDMAHDLNLMRAKAEKCFN